MQEEEPVPVFSPFLVVDRISASPYLHAVPWRGGSFLRSSRRRPTGRTCVRRRTRSRRSLLRRVCADLLAPPAGRVQGSESYAQGLWKTTVARGPGPFPVSRQ